MSLKLTSYKGTRDLYPVDMAERRYIFDGWRVIATRYGYKEYMTGSATTGNADAGATVFNC